MPRDAITCHVLDTSAGRPARGMRVRLEVEGGARTASASASGSGAAPPAIFDALTDHDGRVATWRPCRASAASADAPVHALDDVLAAAAAAAATPSRCTLRFDTDAYFAPADTFFPEAVVVFRVHSGQHYHVPLLLSPYSYTTYRGS